MDLQQQLLEDQKKAMKAKEKQRLNVIRSLRSELRNAEIAQNRELSEEEMLEVLQREIKRRRESLADYERAERPSLLKELQEEIETLSSYLPPQLSEDEIREMVKQVISEMGVSSKREMGRVMGQIMPRVKGKADGSQVKKIVEEMLE